MPKASGINSSGNRGFLCLLLFFPFVLASLGSGLIRPDPESARRSSLEEKLDEAIGCAEPSADPMKYFSMLFGRIERGFSASSKGEEFLKRIREALRKRFPGMVSMVRLLPDGSPDPDIRDRPVARSLSRRFVREYRSFVQLGEPPSSLTQSFIQGFLGHVPRGMEIHGQFLFSSFPPRERYVFLSKPGDKGTFIIFFEPSKPLAEVALEDCLNRLNRGLANIRLHAAFRGESERSLSEKLGVPSWKSLGEMSDDRRWVGNRLIQRRILAPSVWVLGELTDTGGGADSRLERIWLPLVVPTILFLLLSAFPGLIQKQASSRTTIVAAFLYTSAVPLVIMGWTADQFLGERRAILEDEVFQECGRNLMALDRAFSLHIGRLRQAIEVFGPDVRPGENPLDSFLRELDIWKKRLAFDSCEVFDEVGKPVFSFRKPGSAQVKGGEGRFLEKNARVLLKRCNADSAPPPGGPEKTEGKAVDHHGSPDDKVGIETGLLPAAGPVRPWFFHHYNLQTRQFYLACVALGTPEGRATHLVLFSWDRTAMQVDYLRKVHAAFSRRFSGGGLFVCGETPTDPRIPRSFRYRSEALSLASRIRSSTPGVRQLISRGDGRLLLTGIQGTELKGFRLLGIVLDQEIRSELSGLAWKLRFVTLAILGAGLLIGTFLTRMFLLPIRNLETGVKALEHRRFEVRIPEGSADELGMLARLMNSIMTDLADLEVARTVQESLFPRGKLQAGAWEVFGSCVTASRVGGDYFDYGPLDDDHVIIVIGDVTGHGVGAALVVSMVKAILSHPSTDRTPVAALEMMHRILVSSLHRKKMITCAIGILHLPSGRFRWANAGHPFPFLIRKGRAVSQGLSGFPVGAAKARFSEAEIALEPEDCLVYYTDGLMEARGHDGQMLGWDILEQVLPGLVRESPARTEAAIRDWFRTMTDKDPPEDDVTILVIQRGRNGGGAA